MVSLEAELEVGILGQEILVGKRSWEKGNERSTKDQRRRAKQGSDRSRVHVSHNVTLNSMYVFCLEYKPSQGF